MLIFGQDMRVKNRSIVTVASSFNPQERILFFLLKGKTVLARQTRIKHVMLE